mmetsp:Transcript_39812/g.93785  ORF Transcript_39812/g.93785 Transcript_39812/m.93785 type:complete len:154 (-) Transcript_39812:32-493(-)
MMTATVSFLTTATTNKREQKYVKTIYDPRRDPHERPPRHGACQRPDVLAPGEGPAAGHVPQRSPSSMKLILHMDPHTTTSRHTMRCWSSSSLTMNEIFLDKVIIAQVLDGCLASQRRPHHRSGQRTHPSGPPSSCQTPLTGMPWTTRLHQTSA